MVLTNDDGISAPGLEALRIAVAPLGRCLVVAPSGPQSGCSHSVTTHLPIQVTEHDSERLSVDGTPADCVRLALARFETEAAWVVSGINAGGNLGVDVYLSGTVAAAREAAIHGVPAIAISHYIRKGIPLDWNRAARLSSKVITYLMNETLEPRTFWNVNLPHLEPEASDPGWILCDVDPSPFSLDYTWEGHLGTYQGVYSNRPRRPGSDISVCFGGSIAISRIKLN